MTPGNGQSVHVMAIHEDDQYLQDIPAVEVALQHSVDPDYGDLWSGRVDVSAPAGQPVGSRWGTPGRASRKDPPGVIPLIPSVVVDLAERSACGRCTCVLVSLTGWRAATPRADEQTCPLRGTRQGPSLSLLSGRR